MGGGEGRVLSLTRFTTITTTPYRADREKNTRENVGKWRRRKKESPLESKRKKTESKAEGREEEEEKP